MSVAARYRALLLAGSRGGVDPLLAGTDCSHKALLPIAGVPMLERVAAAVDEAGPFEMLAVSTDDEDILQAVPTLERLASAGKAERAASGSSPAASLLAYRESIPPADALFVTTADHALLTPEMVREFLAAAEASPADVVVGVVPASVFRRAYPDLPRTFIRFRDEAFSGANLFAFKTANSAAVARFWLRAESNRKRPWRLIGLFGIANLLRFVTGRLDTERAMSEASRILGTRVALVPMADAESAIDVDRPSDLDVVVRILSAREAV
jgi:CMP-2-keto-3-deoxyoctulosonic acid synthetase